MANGLTTVKRSLRGGIALVALATAAIIGFSPSSVSASPAINQGKVGLSSVQLALFSRTVGMTASVAEKNISQWYSQNEPGTSPSFIVHYVVNDTQPSYNDGLVEAYSMSSDSSAFELNIQEGGFTTPFCEACS